MPTYTETVRDKLRALLGTNKVSDIDAGFLALAEDVQKALEMYGLKPKGHVVSAEAKKGELFVAEKGMTVTLPKKPALGTLIGVWNFSSENVKVTIVGGNINGDFSIAPETVTLGPLQHVMLATIESLGEGNYLIVAGEPDGKWEPITLGGKAEAFGGTLPVAGAKKGPGSAVRLRGAIKAREEIPVGNVIGSLPAGYGPSSQIWQPTLMIGASGTAEGDAVLEISGTTILSRQILTAGRSVLLHGVDYSTT